MDKSYNHKDHEGTIYKKWEDSGAFKPKINKKKKPFTIILPPPNASGKMHTGNALMIAIEDILIRWHRMKGEPTLWIPGTDHAGFETQTTFERELKKQNKSRFDFDSKTLYNMIYEFVQQNKSLIESQIREMGASVDWSRIKFTLKEDSINTVYNTFKQMYEDGIIYRGYHIVNYSFKWGTTFSDAEIQYKESVDPLYFVKYKLVNPTAEGPDHIVVATVRPETIMADTHLAINPKDKRAKNLRKIKVLNPITNNEMEIIEDSFVDPEFGTGIVKITPAHDKNDYEVGLRHGLRIISVINHQGRMNEKAGSVYYGLTIKEARAKVVENLQESIVKVQEDYTHQVPVDYRSGDYVENLVLPNWFVKVDDPRKSFKKPAYEAVKKGVIKIYPSWRKITYLKWMESMRDWPISRQIVWGIRIPVWFKVTEENKMDFWVSWIDKNNKPCKDTLDKFLNEGNTLFQIKEGLQRVVTLTSQAEKQIVIQDKDPSKEGDEYLPDTDTFDTWFSSGQWPLITLGYPDSDDFKYFYPTSVLETGWEIVTRWVSRMIMFGYYLTGKPPFTDVYLHGIVRATDGRKMSKSLGNVISPEEYINEYGTDALRMGLIAGTSNGKDFNFPKEKVLGYKKFANKIWNMARFILIMFDETNLTKIPGGIRSTEKVDREILLKLSKTIDSVDQSLTKFRFSEAAEAVYQFVWHNIADTYLESIKLRNDKDVALNNLLYIFSESLKLLHPFMPFVTEAIWQELGHKDLLITSEWPKA